jgi:cardiolipin synthase
MDRIWTVPNAISVARLACVPWFVYLVYGPKDLNYAAYLLAVLGSTDWVDGQIARRFNQVTTFGKVFDPTVDRIMLGAATIVMLQQQVMPLWFGLAILAREVFVGLAGVTLALLGAQRIDVQLVGKAGAFFLMVSLPLFLVSVSGVTWHEQARLLAWLCGIPGLALSWISVAEYVSPARRAFSEGRKKRLAG